MDAIRFDDSVIVMLSKHAFCYAECAGDSLIVKDNRGNRRIPESSEVEYFGKLVASHCSGEVSAKIKFDSDELVVRDQVSSYPVRCATVFRFFDRNAVEILSLMMDKDGVIKNYDEEIDGTIFRMAGAVFDESKSCRATLFVTMSPCP